MNQRTASLVVAVLFLLQASAVAAPAWAEPEPPMEPSTPFWIDPALERAFDEAPDEPRLVLLGLERPATDAVKDHLREHGLSPLAFRHVPVAAVAATRADLDPLLTTPGLLSLSANRPLETMALPSFQASNFGGLGDQLTRADQARAMGFDGEGVLVGVVDTGVNGAYPHPGLLPAELGGPLVQNVKVLLGRDTASAYQPSSPVQLYLENLTSSDLTDGHGTHVSSIAVGDWTDDGRVGGRAPGADLLGLGTGDALAILWPIAAYDWVLDHLDQYDVRVINNSYGAPGPYAPLDPLNLATKAADEAGILVVFSAGNSGPAQRTLNRYAQAPHVLAVGATTMSGAVASFSSRGDPQSGKPGPDLVAPGADVVGARSFPVSVNEITLKTAPYDMAMVPAHHVPLYRPISGTSMAAPQVTGIAALMFQADPALTPSQARTILTETARPIMGFAEIAQGAGMVDAEAAVRAALGQDVAAGDWVEPTVVERDGDSFVYPFHGAGPGAPSPRSAFLHEQAFPVRLPSEGVQVQLAWEPLGPVHAVPQTVENPVRFTLVAPDGTEVERHVATDLGEAGGSYTFEVAPAVLEAHAKPGWSGAYWTVVAELRYGGIQYDVTARVSYENGTLPPIERTPLPPPPEPPDLVPHEPIRIAKDADFTAENGVTGGSGTPDDPYVIEGWEIYGGSGAGILMGGNGRAAPSQEKVIGTSAHVVIRNVHIHDARLPCIRLDNADNVRVENSLLEGCSDGVHARGGTENLVVQDNEVRLVEIGVGAFGATGVTVRANTFHSLGNSGVAAAQGLVQGGSTTTDLLVADNTFLGEDAEVVLTTPLAFGATIRNNTFGDGAAVRFNLGTWGNVVSQSHWLDGEPRIVESLLLVDSPAETPTNTVVDAGSDRTPDENGQVCFADARAELDPTRQLVRLEWDFGDGQGVQGEIQPCHTYDDPTGTYTARLLVTVQEGLEDPRTLEDTVIVAP